MSDLLLQFIYALFATCGFAIIFRVPLKHFPVCMIIGGLAWSCYQICLYYNASAVVGCFIAACLVGLLSDICSRVFKEAATIFIIPGMISLVPGYNIYYTMEALLSSELGDAAKVGSQTLLMAGAIAAGLLVIGAVINVVLDYFFIMHFGGSDAGEAVGVSKKLHFLKSSLKMQLSLFHDRLLFRFIELFELFVVVCGHPF